MRTQVFIGKNVHTPEGKNLFHATAMSVHQRQPTTDDRAYLTGAQHLESCLPPTIIINGMAVVHELNVHKSHNNCQDHSAFFIRVIVKQVFRLLRSILTL